jgi:hypothetical protein
VRSTAAVATVVAMTELVIDCTFAKEQAEAE